MYFLYPEKSVDKWVLYPLDIRGEFCIFGPLTNEI